MKFLITLVLHKYLIKLIEKIPTITYKFERLTSKRLLFKYNTDYLNI